MIAYRALANRYTKDLQDQRGGGVVGSQLVQLYIGAQETFGDLTPYTRITCAQDSATV